MKRSSTAFVWAIILVLVAIVPVLAQEIPSVYLNTSRTEGNEDGSRENPYNTRDEAVAYGQSLDDGAFLITLDIAGQIVKRERIDPVYSGAQGVPLPRILFYVLLALLALVLLIVGWWLTRRPRQYQT